MNMPMYVSPEQVMKDRADYARKGIARGRAAVASTYADGVLLCAENPSNTLRKVSETTGSASSASASTTSSTSCGWPVSATPT